METNHHHSNDDSNDDKPHAKRFKMESECSTTSSKPESKEPFLTLSTEIIAKTIVLIPVDQWAALELLDEHFRASTFLAWRQLRMINFEREFFDNKSKNNTEGKRSLPSLGETVAMVNSILHKLAERSPFLTRLTGFQLQSVNANMNSDAIRSIARFEHLQSLTVGDAIFHMYLDGGTPLENVVEFLESTQSRTSLKELRLIHVDQLRANRATILDQFASSLVTGRDIRGPLKLEKFSFMSDDYFLRIRLDTLDTTRLTDVRLGKIYVDPTQLTNLIERASILHRIDLSLIYCRDECNNGPRLAANKKLLTALASHESLTTIYFVSPHNYNASCSCTTCGPELIDMLKTIGGRGRLRKLAFNDFNIHPSSIDTEDMCATIRQHIPYLRSTKIFADVYGVNYGGFVDIFNMTELEEIDVRYMPYTTWTENVIKQIAQLPHLKRLRLCSGDNHENFKFLTNAKTLMDLRISSAYLLSRAPNILDEWTSEFVSNLETLMLSCGGGKYDDDENPLVRLLAKAVRLRVLLLQAVRITDRSLTAIAHSCPQLETLSVRSDSNEISVQCLQEIVTRCPDLTRLDGFRFEISNQLQIPKSRRIDGVDADIWNFDDDD